MKYVRNITLAIGLILMILALNIMFRQTIGQQEVSPEPVYVQDVQKYITVKTN